MSVYKKNTITEVQNNPHSELHSKINEHESKLVKVETILERVALNQDSMAESLQAITKSMGKQEIILEKLTHLEENTKGSINRLHTRIDKEVEAREEKLKVVNIALNDLDLARILSKYPKIALAVFITSYLFTIKDFRDAIFGGP